MLRFVDLQEKPDSDDHARITSLSFTDKNPNYLTVVGELLHGAEIRPRTRKDAERLINWLKKIKRRLPE